MEDRFEKIRKRMGYQVLFDAEDIEDALRFAKDNRFKAVELNMNGIDFLPENYYQDLQSHIVLLS